MGRGWRKSNASADEEAALESHVVLSEVLDKSYSAIIVFNNAGVLLAASDSALKMLCADKETAHLLDIDDVMGGNGFVQNLQGGNHSEGTAEIERPGQGKIIVRHESKAHVSPGIHMTTMYPAKLALSKREKEVLLLLAKGETNQTIAKKLHLSPETVRHYTRGARQKLGARSRSHAIAIAIATGQVDADSILA